MRTSDRKTRLQVEEPTAARLPYEPPRLEVLELRPEEQLLACAKLDHKHCGRGVKQS